MLELRARYLRTVVLIGWLVAMGCSHKSPAGVEGPPIGNVPTEQTDHDPVTTSTCIAKSGCRTVQPIPKCPAGLTIKTLTDVTAHGNGLLGKQIAVRGPLHRTTTGCSDKTCAPGECCNQCGAHLVMATHDDVPMLDGARDAILFESVGDPKRFKCEGDDSGVCCPTRPDGTEVIAQGTLAHAGFKEASRTWTLLEATLCSP